MVTDGLVLEARTTRASNGRDWIVFRDGEWTLAVWRDDRGGRIHLAPCERLEDLPGVLLGAAPLDPDVIGDLPIAMPVDPILERVAQRLWTADLSRHEMPSAPWTDAGRDGLVAELAAAIADAVATPLLIAQLREIGRELDGDTDPP